MRERKAAALKKQKMQVRVLPTGYMDIGMVGRFVLEGRVGREPVVFSVGEDSWFMFTQTVAEMAMGISDMGNAYTPVHGDIEGYLTAGSSGRSTVAIVTPLSESAGLEAMLRASILSYAAGREVLFCRDITLDGELFIERE